MKPPPTPPSPFPATAWTLFDQVRCGGAEAEGALETIARNYWKPVYVYVCRKGWRKEEAEDLVQSFFLHLLEKDLLARPDRHRGRFRNWLRAVLEHFLANQARLRSAARRGGGRRSLSLDFRESEEALAAGPEDSPEAAFDRIWALEVLNRAFSRLEREMVAAGKEQVLAALRERLGMEGKQDSLSVGDVAVHRARKRLRALILDEVGDSLRDPDEVSPEVTDLFRAFGEKP